MSEAISIESGEAIPAVAQSKLEKRSSLDAAADLGAAALLGSGALVAIALTTTAYFLALKELVDLIFP